MSKHIAVVGGGLMGCLGALAVAARGHRVSIFERENALLTRASANNEGKVHLGFTFGLDGTGQTQKLMMQHGLRFEADLQRLLGADISGAIYHRRGIYAVPEDSALQGDGILAHLEKMAGFFNEESAGQGDNSNGPFYRQMKPDERRGLFSDRIIDAYDVMELSSDCQAICDLTREAVLSHRNIEVVTGADVTVVNKDGVPGLSLRGGQKTTGFDHVVNAAWDGLSLLRDGPDGSEARDHGLCLRAKTGFVAEVKAGMPPLPVTFCWGPFGDLVPFGPNRAYISWYPVSLMAFSTDLSKGAAWYDEVARSFDFDTAYEASRKAFADLMPGLTLADKFSEIRGGAILAAARTDLYDPQSGLHARTAIGISTAGNLTTVNTGKYTCAPAFALELAERF